MLPVWLLLLSCSACRSWAQEDFSASPEDTATEAQAGQDTHDTSSRSASPALTEAATNVVGGNGTSVRAVTTSATSATTSATTSANTSATTSVTTSPTTSATTSANTTAAAAASRLSTSSKQPQQCKVQHNGTTTNSTNFGNATNSVNSTNSINSTSWSGESGCLVSKPAGADLDDWDAFKRKHNKSYYKRKQLRVMARMLRGTNVTLDHLSDEDRRLMYMGRKASVEEFNKKGSSYKKAVNKFADLTANEVVTRHTGLQLAGRMPRGRKVGSLGRLLNLAPRVDWRERGALTPVKEQGMCGCCWAFAATAALESMHFILTGRLVVLSEQNMIDCDNGNTECRGGTPWNAFDWVQANGGMEEEARYPYQVAAMKCRQRKEELYKLGIVGYRQVLESPEDNLMKILAEKGPVVVSVNAGLDSFMAYQSGVYADSECGSTLDDLNHAMLAVGYGIDPVDGPYWILRNSWGQDWGEKGYIRISRKDNMCGVRTLAVYPVVE